MKKRRFAFGGFSDIDEGRDTPDQALARKASDSKYASDAADKAAGLKASKGEDVGFFKRLGMGNIDDASSEANQQFGAGKTRLANIVPPRPRESMGKTEGMPTPVAAPVAAPVRPQVRPSPGSLPSFDDFKRDNTPIDMAESPMLRAGTPTGPGTYKRDTEGEAASTLARESVRKTPTNAPVKPTISASNKPMPPAPVAPAAVSKIASVDPRDAEAGNTRGTNPDTMMMGKGRRAVTGEIANLDSTAVRDRKSAQMMMDQDEKLRVKKAAGRLGQTLAPSYPSYPKDTGEETILNKRGGKIKAYAKGGSVSASSRGDGCAQRGKTRGMMR